MIKRIFFVMLVGLGLLENKIAVTSDRKTSSAKEQFQVTRTLLDRKKEEISRTQGLLENLQKSVDFNWNCANVAFILTVANSVAQNYSPDYYESNASSLITGIGFLSTILYARTFKNELRKFEIQKNCLNRQVEILTSIEESCKDQLFKMVVKKEPQDS